MRKLLVAISLFLMTTLVHATTFDAVTAFSATSNPNGVWSYGYGTPLNFQLYDHTITSGGTTNWVSSSIGTLPALLYNPSGFSGTTNSFPATELGLHPGPSATDQDSILEFTAPATGLYSLSSSFTRRDNTANGNGVDVSVYLDGVLLSGSFDYLSNTSGHVPFYYNNSALSLVAGDTLRFDVSNNGEYTYDTTGVTAQLTHADTPVSVTPEPSTWVLLGSGMLSAFVAGRRKLSKV